MATTTEIKPFKLQGRPCESSSYSFVPTNPHQVPILQEITVFNTPIFIERPNRENDKKVGGATYDRIFQYNDRFNPKLHRDDREHAKSINLDVHSEEKHKTVPSLSSTEYGHRLNQPIEELNKLHNRVGYVQSEFYRRNMFN